MTFTARLAVLVSRHRILVYVLGTLALTAYLVLGFSPTAAISDTLAIKSPADVITDAKGNCTYLTICRWGNLSSFGEPPIIGIPLLFIINIMFAIAHFIFFIIGQAFMYVGDLGFYNKLLFFGDGVFSKVSLLQNNELAAGNIIGTLLFAGLAVAVFIIIRGVIGGSKSSHVSPLKTGAWMVAGILSLSIMATASSKNHDGTSPISKIAASESSNVYNDAAQNSIASDTVAAAAKDPTKWQPYSLGWVIAWGNTAASGLANVAVVTIGSVTQAMTVKTNAVPTSCDIYIESMHDLYLNGDRNPATTNKFAAPTKTVLELEKLYRSAVLDPYVASNFGSSRGAKSGWCRVMEAKKPVNEQVLIAANVKKLPYGNVEQYRPALEKMVVLPALNDAGQITNGGEALKWTTGPENKSSVSGNTKFVGESWGAGLATSYFGPVKFEKDEGTLMMHAVYFGMCIPDREQILLNPDWDRVTQANKEASFGDLKSDDGKNICTAMATGDSKGIKDAGDTSAIGFMSTATDASGESGKKEFQERIDYMEKNRAEQIVDILFNGNVNRESKFIAAEGGASGPAYNYFTSVNGSNWSASFFPALIMLFVTVLIAKIAFPVVVGGTVAQFFGAAAMMIVAFSLMAVAVWPTHKVRSFAIRVFAVIISGSVITTLFTIIFMVYAGLFGFIKSVLFVGQGNKLTGIADFIINGVPLLLAGLISYTLMKILLAKLLKFDTTNLKSAAGSSMNAVLSPLSKNNEGVGQILTSPFKSAASLVTTPVKDTKDQWSGLRNAKNSVLDTTSNILTLKDRVNNIGNGSKLTPAGATSTANAGRADGTDADPLIGAVMNGPGTRPNTSGARPHGAGANHAGLGKPLTDEQHRQRLIDQLSGAYGKVDTTKAFPNGVPGDYAKLIATAPLDEVKKLSLLLDARVEGSEGPRATPQQAAANMQKFADMAAETMKNNPNGFDPSVGYAERAATQANMFRGASPMQDSDLKGMSAEDTLNLNSRKFDRIGDNLPDGRTISFGDNADVIPGEVVSDPLTSRSVPNAIVRSGSQNLAGMEGVTQDGTTLYGAKREQNADGTFGEEWALSTLDSGSRQLPSSMFGSAVPPAGVNDKQWEDVTDLHAWIKDNNIQMDSTAMSSWPAPRREQADRVGEIMSNVMSAQGVPMVNADSLETLAGSGVGLTSADESFTFGEATPNSEFSPNTMRKALAEGKDSLLAIENQSAQRAEMMMNTAVGDQLRNAEMTIKQREGELQRQLDSRTSLVNERAEKHLSGLIDSLADSNTEEAREIAQLVSNGDWDEITEMLNESAEENDEAASLKEEIRSIVDDSKARIQALDSDHRTNVAQLYAQLAEEREAITEVMHRDIEAELQNDIERNIDNVRELAFSGVSESSKRHVEGMLSWFPAIKGRFFSGNAHPDRDDLDDMEDADGDGIDDRYQAHL